MATIREHVGPVDSEHDRVRSSTDSDVLARLDAGIRRRVEDLAGEPQRIQRRLDELAREWSIERALEVNASSLILLGTLATRTRSPRWLLLPFVVAAFLLQHGIQGWCPPLPVLRRLGLRSRREIDAERYALKALRGDFEGVASSGDADRAIAAVRR